MAKWLGMSQFDRRFIRVLVISTLVQSNNCTLVRHTF